MTRFVDAETDAPATLLKVKQGRLLVTGTLHNMPIMDGSSSKKPDLLFEVLRDDTGRYSLHETTLPAHLADRSEKLTNNPDKADFYDAVERRKDALDSLGVSIDFRDLPASEA